MFISVGAGAAVATLALMVRAVARVAAAEEIFCTCFEILCCWFETENAAVDPTERMAMMPVTFMMFVVFL